MIKDQSMICINKVMNLNLMFSILLNVSIFLMANVDVNA